VEQVPDRDGEVLRYLSMLGLVPGQDVELLDAAPFAGPLTIRTSGGETAISRELAAQIRVSS
jgi:DtxR family Mn-dependent transcriptional regulator